MCNVIRGVTYPNTSVGKTIASHGLASDSRGFEKAAIPDRDASYNSKAKVLSLEDSLPFYVWKPDRHSLLRNFYETCRSADWRLLSSFGELEVNWDCRVVKRGRRKRDGK